MNTLRRYWLPKLMNRARSITASRRVLLDSSAFLALVSRRDAHHDEAQSAWARLIDERWSTFTSNFVVAETHALFLARLGRDSATTFLRDIVRSSTVMVRVSVRDEARARAIIFQYEDKEFSLTDATSFAVMERLRILEAFSFDRHFAQYGFPPIHPGVTH